jgi:hypothetical protein
MDLAPGKMLILNSVRSDVYTGRSLPDTWLNLSANSIGILNAHTLLRLESKERGLAHRKHWYPVRQPLHTGGFHVALEAVYYLSKMLININKLVSYGEQYNSI